MRTPARSRATPRSKAAKAAIEMPPATAEPFIRPYRPSWFDGLTAAVDRLPGPYWAAYALGFLIYLGLGALAGRTLSLEVVYTHSIPFYGFWLIHYLDRRAAASLEDFRPAFTGSESDLQEVRWRLTTLPAVPALAVTLAALLLGIASSLGWSRAFPDWPLSRLAYYGSIAFGGLYAYHSVAQLRLVTSLYSGRARVDLHNVAPLRSFSTLTAHTAIGMLLLLSGAVLLTSERLTGVFLVGSLLFAGLAVLTFLLPLTGLQRRLAAVKAKELAELARRWQVTMAELYRLIDRGDLGAADRLNGTLAALERGRTAIERIPTWPWRPETLRGMVGALVLPIMIFTVQRVLGRLLG